MRFSRAAVIVSTAGVLIAPAAVANASVTLAEMPDSGTWQTNGVVWAQAYFGGDLIIGGDFTTLRPPGAAPGTQEIKAPHLAALRISTGAPDPNFDPSHLGTNGVVYALTPSPDGRHLYVGGSFTRIFRTWHRGNIAVINTGTFHVKSSFDVKAGSNSTDVRTIVTSPDGSTVYLGGTFGSLDGKRRRFLGAVTPSGTVLPWAAGNTMDGSVRTLIYAKSSSGDRIIAGGYWTKVQGVADHWSVGLDTTAGAVIPGWKQVPHDFYACPKGSYVADMVTDGTRVVLGIGGYRFIDGTTKHCDEGLLAINPVDGSFDYFLETDGDVQALSIIGQQVYASGHFKHAMDRTGACGTRNKSNWRAHLFSATSSGVLDCTWTPQMNGAKGGWSSATDGTHLSFGGDFDQVQYATNQTLHQGVVQFSAGG